jgi:hypothetical protein
MDAVEAVLAKTRREHVAARAVTALDAALTSVAPRLAALPNMVGILLRGVRASVGGASEAAGASSPPPDAPIYGDGGSLPPEARSALLEVIGMRYGQTPEECVSSRGAGLPRAPPRQCLAAPL